MKKILSILLVSVLLIGCSENRVLYDDLINKGSDGFPIGELTDDYNSIIVYHNNKLYSGIGFEVYPNGNLKYESNFKDGRYHGLQKGWHENGQLKM